MKTLFEKPLSHTDDPITSYEAADRMVKSGKLGRQEEEVYRAILTILQAPPTTDDFTAKEIASWCWVDYYKIQRRLSGLRNKGRIERIQIGIKITHTRSIPSLKIEKPIYKTRDGCCVWKIRGLNNENR